ncbi:PIG-P-domain-containing protein [Parasitella parasitica]|nr:PIG-P-domain-containing protein [Parasitella parasitica]
MVIEQEKLDKNHVPTTLAKRFIEKSANTNLSTSRSTSSLPNLVNYAILSATASLSRRQIADMSTSMRRGYSEHDPINMARDQPKTDSHRTTKRRHSFSSFLNAKYGKSATADEDDDEFRDYKRLSATSTVNSNSAMEKNSLNGVRSKTNQAKKGHRPRSYSEVPYNLPHVERAPPVAITNKTPAYEYYGFVMYLSSFVALGIYLIWAYVPDEILHSLGITYYPNRYWALAIPIWLMTFVWFIFISFMTINLMNTAPFYYLYCITGNHA